MTMFIKRFLFFWVADYLAATLVVYVISKASVSVFDFPQLSYIVLFFIPLSTLFFSWLFYRSLKGISARRFLVATLWVGVAMIVDASVYGLVYKVTPFLVVTSPLLLAVYASKFLAVFVGAYLGTVPKPAVDVADDMLSPRST